MLHQRLSLLTTLHHLAADLPVRLAGQLTPGLRVDDETTRVLEATCRRPWAVWPEHRWAALQAALRRACPGCGVSACSHALEPALSHS